jgi:hypothetical protein
MASILLTNLRAATMAAQGERLYPDEYNGLRASQERWR